MQLTVAVVSIRNARK